MRVFILGFFIIFITSSTFANESEIASCEKEGTRFGNGAGKDEIHRECLEKFSQKASAYTKRKGLDGKFSAFGHKNIIFINDPKTRLRGQNVITGKFTELEEVTALALDEENKEMAVIDRSRDILVYSSVITGNVAPLRMLKSPDIEGAVDLVINPKKDQLIVLNPSSKQILIFSRLANIHAPQGKKKLEVLKRIGKMEGEILALDHERQELFVVNAQAGFILGWDLESFEVRKISFPAVKDEVKAVQFSPSDESLHLVTEKKDFKISVKLEKK